MSVQNHTHVHIKCKQRLWHSQIGKIIPIQTQRTCLLLWNEMECYVPRKVNYQPVRRDGKCQPRSVQSLKECLRVVETFDGRDQTNWKSLQVKKLGVCTRGGVGEGGGEGLLFQICTKMPSDHACSYACTYLSLLKLILRLEIHVYKCLFWFIAVHVNTPSWSLNT